MIRIVLFLLAAISITMAGDKSKEKVNIEQVWATDPVLQVPESILYDQQRDVIYVSNINGKPLQKNSEGFISRLNLKGDVLDLKWVTGLDAPKGCDMRDSLLYVSDIDRVVVINIIRAEIVNTYKAEKGEFLNDIRIDQEGRVYVSDMSENNSVIYRIADNKLEPWLKGDEVKRPNGLFMTAKHLIFGNSGDGHIKSADLESREIKPLINVSSGIDGLVAFGDNAYIFSNWAGKTAIAYSDGNIHELLNTTEKKINSADIEYIPQKHLLLIPTFFDNRVVAYKLK